MCPEKQQMNDPITLFLCGDVMLGRGIDQVLPHPSDPLIHEGYVKSARGYVELAERWNGPIPSPVRNEYVWGDALRELEAVCPDLRIINLETSVTQSDAYWKGKGIHYRMNPENIDCLTAADIDLCVLANNHVLDWGYPGLEETLDCLRRAGVKSAGAGETLQEARQPVNFDIRGKGKVKVFACGAVSSGIPASWAAAENKPGVNLLSDLSGKTVRTIRELLDEGRREREIRIISIHWGGNWGYGIPGEHIRFAHRLIDEAGVDIVHGHSSHHVMGIEVYQNRLILYGCGDFINDYEGISGYETYRGDLALMYFASLAPATGELVQLKMIPTQTRHFKVNKATASDARWLRDVLNRESAELNVEFLLNQDHTITLFPRY